jgi:hypothetical protein
LVGLKYLRASQEFVIYDDQPPPSGEYVMQTLGISTLEYGGVKQNHLLVTFKSGQLTGFGTEDTYNYQEVVLAGANIDYPIDVTLALSRSGRTIILFANRNIQIKYNSISATAIDISVMSLPWIIDLGLNIASVYITTTQDTTVRMMFI